MRLLGVVLVLVGCASELETELESSVEPFRHAGDPSHQVGIIQAFRP